MYTVCIKSLPPLSQRYAQPFIQNKLKSPSPNQSCIFIILQYYLPLETDMALHLKKKWKSLQPRTIWDKFGWNLAICKSSKRKTKDFHDQCFFTICHYLSFQIIWDNHEQISVTYHIQSLNLCLIKIISTGVRKKVYLTHYWNKYQL